MEQRQEGGLWQRRTHVAKRSLGHIVIEYERRNIRERLDSHRRTIGRGNAFDDLRDAGLEMLHELDVEAAQRAFEHAGIWYNVGRLATGKLANGQCDLLGRRHFASDELLKRQVHMDAGRDGVDTDLGARAVAALALKRDAETVHARERRAAVEHQAKRRLAIDMHGKGGLGARVLQQTVGDGGAGALKGFLARLEQQLNRGVGVDKLGLAGLEQARRTKQRRRMHIVSACVHAAVDGGKRLSRLLGNRQGIHIATEHDDRTGLLVRTRTVTPSSSCRAGTDEANDTGAVNKHGIGNIHLVQTRLDIRGRLRKVVTELRRLMEIMAPCGKLIGKRLSFCDQAIADSGLRHRSGLRRWLRLKIGQSWCHRCPPVTFLQQAL